VQRRDDVRSSDSDPAIHDPAEVPAIPAVSDAPGASTSTPETEAPRDVRTIKRALLGVLLLGVLGVCYIAQEVLIPLTLALLLSLLLSPVVTLSQRARLPRAAGSILVLVVVVAAFAGEVNHFLPNWIYAEIRTTRLCGGMLIHSFARSAE
jgi:hypothetical protein